MGRRKDVTPKNKNKRKRSNQTAPSPFPCSARIQNLATPPPGENVVEVEGAPEEEFLHTKNSPLPVITLDENLQPILQEAPCDGKENTDDPVLRSNIVNGVFVPTEQENIHLSPLEEKNDQECVSPTCNPQEENPKDNAINMTCDQGLISIRTAEVNSIEITSAKQDRDSADLDILLTSSVEETQFNTGSFLNNETSSGTSYKHNKTNDDPGNRQAPEENIGPVEELASDVEVLQPDNSYITICNELEHHEPQILGLNNNGNLLVALNESLIFNNNEKNPGVEIEDFQAAKLDIHGRHSACCNLVTLLTNQNDTLRNEVHGLKNELASLSCQMFDLEARCGKLESTNRQLLCRIREYADLGSREEILRCGEQIGQLTDFLQAMLQDIPANSQNVNNAYGSGPSFFHPLN